MKNKIKRVIACLALMLALVGVGTVTNATPATAISGCYVMGTTNGGRTGSAICTSWAGPATSYAVLVRCQASPTVWHLGPRRYEPWPPTYASSYTCPTGSGNVYQISIQLYF